MAERLIELDARDVLVGDVVYVEGTGYEVGAKEDFPQQDAVLLYLHENGGPVKMAKLFNKAKVQCSWDAFRKAQLAHCKARGLVSIIAEEAS